MSDTKQTKPSKPPSILEVVEIVTRSYKSLKTRQEVEKLALKGIAELLAALDNVAEQRDQITAFNKVLKTEGQKLVDYANLLSAEVEKLRTENAALQKLLDEATKPTSTLPVPVAGKCQTCQHDGQNWHNNPSKVCSKDSCPCMKFVAPVSA